MLPEAQAHACGELVTQLSRPGAGPDPTATLGNLDSFPKVVGGVRKESRNLALRSEYPKHGTVFCDKGGVWPYIIQMLGRGLLPV